jgi:hypothetical protein
MAVNFKKFLKKWGPSLESPRCNTVAIDLRSAKYKKRIMKSKRDYSRKGKLQKNVED